MKIKKYQIITALISIYALFMTFYFGLDLLKSGETIRFWLTFLIEIIVIIMVYFALKKRDYYRAQRKKELEND